MSSRRSFAFVSLLTVISLLLSTIQPAARALPAQTSAPAPTLAVLRDWATLTYDNTQYTIKLALKSGTITGPLSRQSHDSQVEGIGVYTSTLVTDDDLARRLVFLAQNRELIMADTTGDWKHPPESAYDQYQPFSGVDNNGKSFVFYFPNYVDNPVTAFERDTLERYLTGEGLPGVAVVLFPSSGVIDALQEKGYALRTRMYRDLLRNLVLPSLDTEQTEDIVREFSQRYQTTWEEALAEVGEPADGYANAEFVANLLEVFGTLSKHAGLAEWCGAASTAFGGLNMMVGYHDAEVMARNILALSYHVSENRDLRLQALDDFLTEVPFDPAARAALNQLKAELTSADQAELIEDFWTAYLAENQVSTFLTIGGMVLGIAQVLPELAVYGTALSAVSMVMATVGAMWFVADYFYDERSRDIMSSMALTLSWQISDWLQATAPFVSLADANFTQRVLVLNNVRHFAAYLWYHIHNRIFNNWASILTNLVIPDHIELAWKSEQSTKLMRFVQTVPRSYLIQPAEATWIQAELDAFEQPLGPAIVSSSVSPEVGSYDSAFHFTAKYRVEAPLPPTSARVVIGSTSYAMSLIETETTDGIVYYYTYSYERSGFAVGTYTYHFEIGAAPASPTRTFQSSSDLSLRLPRIYITAPPNGLPGLWSFGHRSHGVTGRHCLRQVLHQSSVRIHGQCGAMELPLGHRLPVVQEWAGRADGRCLRYAGSQV